MSFPSTSILNNYLNNKQAEMSFHSSNNFYNYVVKTDSSIFGQCMYGNAFLLIIIGFKTHALVNINCILVLPLINIHEPLKVFKKPILLVSLNICFLFVCFFVDV